MDSQESSRSAITEERLESAIANLLRVGVLASAALVGVAGLFYLLQHRTDTVNYARFQMEQNNLRALSGIFASALRLQTDAIIQLGLCLLIATPIARVVLAALGFYLQRDRLYVGVSLIVLAILIFSVTHAF
jgi:uncharacterized membrane protein